VYYKRWESQPGTRAAPARAVRCCGRRRLWALSLGVDAHCFFLGAEAALGIGFGCGGSLFRLGMVEDCRSWFIIGNTMAIMP
jgi:hypothetical protein